MQDIADMEDDVAGKLEEMHFLADPANDGRFMLVQMPPMFPVPETAAKWAGQPGMRAARPDYPCALKDLPCSNLGKLMVMRSGKVKLQVCVCVCGGGGGGGGG
jgi:hypothetical protein